MAGRHSSSARTFEEDADRATGSVLFMLAKASNLLQFLWREPGERWQLCIPGFYRRAGLPQRPAPVDIRAAQGRLFRGDEALAGLLARMRRQCDLGAGTISLVAAMWFFLDELADLPRVDNLTRLLPEGRKFGASVVLTFQAIGQMHRRYGRDSAEALLGCCNTKLLSPAYRPRHAQMGDRTILVMSRSKSAAMSDSFDYGPSSGRYIACRCAACPRSRDRKRYAAGTASRLPATARCLAGSQDQADPRAYRRARQSAKHPELCGGRCEVPLAVEQAARQRCCTPRPQSRLTGRSDGGDGSAPLAVRAQASSYYEADDYYAGDGLSP